MKSSKSFSHAPSKEQFQPWFSHQHWIFSTSPRGNGQPQQSPEEFQCSFLLTDFFPYVSRSQSLKPLQGAEWKMKHPCLEVKPFVFLLAAENSVGTVRRTCPMSVLLKAFLVPWPDGANWLCLHCTELAVVPDTAQNQKSLPLLPLHFSHQDPSCMCSPYPWKKHCSRGSGRLCPHCCGDLSLTTAVFSASVCHMAFQRHPCLICQSAVLSQMGPSKGLISGDHYVGYCIFHMFGLRQSGQAWKCRLSVLDTLSSEVALVVVYGCWRGC